MEHSDLNGFDFELDDIYTLLNLVEDAEYQSDRVGGVRFEKYTVIGPQEVTWGDEIVHIQSGLHILSLNAYTNEWIDYEWKDTL